MPVVGAVFVFLATTGAVVGVAAIAFLVGFAVAGIVFALLWATAAVLLSQLSYEANDRHPLRWAIFGLLLGPIPAAWLAWRVSPKALELARRYG
jgi:hypothetical protein